MITLGLQTPPEAAGLLGTVLFYLLAGLTGASGAYVVASRDVVRMAVGLLFALAGVAGIYFLLDAEFLAAVQLVVYIGGTLILIVFGVMLTSKSPHSRFEPTRGETVAAALIGAVLLGSLVATIVETAGLRDRPGAAAPAGGYPVAALGQALLGDYLAPFELASVVLLVVMIGAAWLARGRRRDK